MRSYAIDTKDKVSEEVTVFGWVDSMRDHGQLLFIDLRDKTGKVQLVINPETQQEVFELAKDLGNEYVISATGVVKERSADLVNPNIATGSIELEVSKLELLNKSNPLPFPINTD